MLSPWRDSVGAAACGGVALIKLHVERVPRRRADSNPKEGQDQESSGGVDSRVVVLKIAELASLACYQRTK